MTSGGNCIFGWFLPSRHVRKIALRRSRRAASARWPKNSRATPTADGLLLQASGRPDLAVAAPVTGASYTSDWIGPTVAADDAASAWLSETLGRDVVLAGSLTDSELHGWYRSADALAFPSTKEGWGLAVLEAMAADLPVVSSDIAVLREYLTPDRTAVMTQVADPASLAAGMRRVVTDAALRETLVHGGRSVVPAYSWARAAEEHARLYAEMAL